MIKHRGYSIKTNEPVCGWYYYDHRPYGGHFIVDNENSKGYQLLCVEVHPDSISQYTGYKNLYGGDKVSFKWLCEYGEHEHDLLPLTGTFQYNPDELRWELDVDKNNYRYEVLSFDIQRMSDIVLL